MQRRPCSWMDTNWWITKTVESLEDTLISRPLFWPFMISVSFAFTPHAPSNPPFFHFLSVSVSDSFTCPQGSARSGWKLFRRPRNPPSAAPRSAPTASPTTPLQTSEARWSSVVTKAECWCPWRGVKSGSAKQNRYFQHRRDFLSIGWRLPVWKSRVIFAVFLKQMKQSWRCSWETQRWPWMCNAENKYICLEEPLGSLRYIVLYSWWVQAHACGPIYCPDAATRFDQLTQLPIRRRAWIVWTTSKLLRWCT